MSQALNNPTGGGPPHRDYGATASTSATTTPEVGFVTGFSPTEFMSLREDITHNINAIKSNAKNLEKSLKLIGTSKELPTLRDQVHSINLKTNASVEQTKQDLLRLKTVVRRGDHQQKLLLDKMTAEFHNVVQKYATLQQKISHETRKMYQISADLESDIFSNTEQQKLQETESLKEDHKLLKERERLLRMLQADIIDVNEIMGILSREVHSQGEQVDTIGTTVGDVADNVKAGTEDLAKASRSRQSYRRKILLLLAIAVIIGLVVTGIIVSKLNS